MKLTGYLKKHRYAIALQLILKISGTIIELAIPFILSYLLDTVIPLHSITYIICYGLLMCLCAFFACYTNIKANRIASFIAKDTVYEIRRDLFNQILYLSKSDQDKIGVEAFVSNITSDSYNLFQMICVSMRLGIRTPFLLIGGIIITLFLESKLALILIGCLPFLIIIVSLICIKNLKQFNKSLKKSEMLITSIKENVTGIKVIKALDKIDYEKNRFNVLNDEVSKLEGHAQISAAVVNPILQFVLDIALALVIVIGATLAKDYLTTPGVIIAFITYFTIMSNALISITRIFQSISKGVTSLKRVKYPFEFKLDEFEKSDLTSDAYIEFRNVCYEVDGKKILDNVSFKLDYGQTLGIIGKSGCGKSTIINLLLRIYKPSSGFIFINHININNYDKNVLNALFGVVFQTDTLFNSTIKENITLFKEYSDEEINEALVNSDALKIVNLHAEGLDYKLSRGALNLSGGQRQRLLIARAIIKKPDILVLDDSFSALDYKTDLLIRTNLKKYNKTNIYIAQRISSIKDADKILVLNNGNVEAYGNILEIKASKTFIELSESQLGGDFDAA